MKKGNISGKGRRETITRITAEHPRRGESWMLDKPKWAPQTAHQSVAALQTAELGPQSPPSRPPGLLSSPYHLHLYDEAC